MAPDTPLTPLGAALARAAAGLVAGQPPPVVLAATPERSQGDLASPLAMGLARAARRPPRDLAGDIAAALRVDPSVAPAIAEIEVAGPGFLNLTMTPAWFAAAIGAINEAGERFGARAASAERVLVEFVSANPTGPLHVGHARHAAYGDSLAGVLEFAGRAVTREFYVNDHGRQMRVFGASVAARYASLVGEEVALPEGGYAGAYVLEVAAELHAEAGDRFAGQLDPLSADALEFFAGRGGELMLESLRADLDRFRVRFDAYFSERSLHADGRVERALAALTAAGDTYESEGALWFRTSAFGDEKDRVLVRGDGAATYLASDVAYHLDKAARADRLLDVLGADHHGYLARLRAVLEAGGHPGEMLEFALLQLVSLMQRGEAKKMSKRAGTLVTLADLIDDIGVDAARFFLVQRSHETPVELDLDLAREQSQENPVYYVQYAHARMSGILRQTTRPADPVGPPAQLEESERTLALRLLEWPEAVAEAEAKRAVHRVSGYLIDLARDFHGFYTRCRVAGEPDPVLAFRLDLTAATGAVLRIGLGLLGVSAPERM